MGRLDGKVAVITGRRRRHGPRGGDRLRRGGGPGLRGRHRRRSGRAGRLRGGRCPGGAGRRRRRGERGGDVRGRRRAVRGDRRPLQQRRHLAGGRRLDPRDRGRRVGPRPEREHEGCLSVLQARDPVPAGAGWRLGDQRGLVRRADGRGDVADLVLGVEGRGAVDVAGARRPVRAPGDPRERALSRARSRRRCCCGSSGTIPPPTSGGASTCRWAGWRNRGRSSTPRCSWRATNRRM